MEFEVNGQHYFLAFVDDERRWYVFSPTPGGVQRTPVYVDAVKYERVLRDESETHTTRH